MTAARKFALVMAFYLETGTDPDDTPSSEQQRQQSARDRDVVNQFEEQFRACVSRADFDRINNDIVECVRAKTISREGAAYLRGPARECMNRLTPAR